MITDLIRVGPPQGAISDLDLNISKNFDVEQKFDFEKKLKEAIQKKDPDQVLDKSSGGNKKKMTRAEDEESERDKPEKEMRPELVVQPVANEEKISNIMVSNEGEVEIAEDEKLLPHSATEPVSNSFTQLENKVVGQPSEAFQHMNATEKALLAEMQIGTDQQPQVENQFNVAPELGLEPQLGEGPQMISQAQGLISTEVMAEGDADLQSQALKGNSLTQDVLANIKDSADMPANTQTDAATTGANSDLESKAYEILSKEAGKDTLKLAEGSQAQISSAMSSSMGDSSSMLEQSMGDSDQSSSPGSDKEAQTDSKNQPLNLDGKHDLAAQVSALQTEQRSFQNHLSGLSAQPAMKTNPEASVDDNIQQIMNQAKFLVTKGGGEMTVKMTPEGLGEVQLKVALDQGKINIEVNAQDKSIKKLIEESLSDLKSSLANHQMRVEHVKINNVTAVDTNNSAQNQFDLNNSNSQEQHRQHQEMNFQNRDHSNFAERRLKHSYSNQQQPAVPAPVVKASVKVNPYMLANKGSSINMVA